MWKLGDLPNLNRLLIPTPKNVSFTLCHASTFRPWPLMIWVGVISSVTPNPEWSPPSRFPQTHTYSNSDDDTPFQQLCSRPYEMGQCESLLISRNSQFLCSLFTTPSPSHHCLCVRSWQRWSFWLLVQKNWNRNNLKRFMFVKAFARGVFIMLKVHVVEMVDVTICSQMPLKCDVFQFFYSSTFALTFCLYYQAGLLGCETVLSSMALMQANNIPGQKRMTSPLGQGHRASPESHQANTHHSHNHHGHQVHHGQAHHSHVGHPSTGSCPPLVR